MEKCEETLRNLYKLRSELEASAHSEEALRVHWRKSKPPNLEQKLKWSLSYQRFLERLIEEVLD